MHNKTVAFVTMLVLLGAFGCAGTPPADLGVHDGLLKLCPRSPNCVSSQANDERHFIDPIVYRGRKQVAFKRLLLLIKSMERTKITEQSDDYLRAEVVSAALGFVDDVEFYFPEDPIIHVRSASRKGYSDLGVNRKRIELVRTLFGRNTKEYSPE